MLSGLWRGVNNPKWAIQVLRYRRRKRRLDYSKEENERAERLANLFDVSEETIRGYENDLRNDEAFHEEVEAKREELSSAGVVSGTTGRMDCTTIYLICRILEPETVVETGVLYGAFDAYILAALDHIGRGELHSLDLPGGPDSEYPYGYLIPDAYRDRWYLELGDASDMLEEWCDGLSPLDLFLHDSQHTVEHMRYEYETTLLRLREGGAIATHDVLLSNVFPEFAVQNQLDHTTIANTGVAVKS